MADGGDCANRRLQSIEVVLDEAELKAIERWRRANSLDSHSDAMRQLFRLGLLSEVGRIYRRLSRDDAESDA